MTTGSSPDKTVNVPMDDMMLAMDVVDTLRHSSRLIEKELASDVQDQELLERLRSVYNSQGIDVPDYILREGVDALREDRFRYIPTPRTFSRRLAEFYVGFKSGTKKPEDKLEYEQELVLEKKEEQKKKFTFKSVIKSALLIPLCVYLVIFIIGNFQVLLPNSEINKQFREKQRLVEASQFMPDELGSLQRRINVLTDNPEIEQEARDITRAAYAALVAKDIDGAVADKEKLQNMSSKLAEEYSLRIVAGSNESSGVWRVPDNNPNARNYYVIVEPVTEAGRVISIDVVNEENNRIENVNKFGIRVPQSVYDSIRNDKQDDGIIQNNIIAVKQRGELEPSYNVETLNGMITQW